LECGVGSSRIVEEGFAAGGEVTDRRGAAIANRRGEIVLAEAGADRLAAAHRETHDRAAFAVGEGAECCSCVCQAVFSPRARPRTL